jgi:hypothetical protein
VGPTIVGTDGPPVGDPVGLPVGSPAGPPVGEEMSTTTPRAAEWRYQGLQR